MTCSTDIVEHVTRQQTLKRERAGLREIPRKDKQKKRRCRHKQKSSWHIKIQIAQIEAAKEQAKIDKELKIKEMELQTQQTQAQAPASSATTPPPRNKDAKSLKLPSFIDKKDELDSFLLRFECYAQNASWEKDM